MTDTTKIYWTEDEKRIATSMTALGKSSRDIGLIINKSRNAVISFWNRTGIKRAARSVPAARIGPIKAAPRINPPQIKQRPPIPDGCISLLHAEEHHCRWIVGDPKNTTICGQQTKNHSSWCADHYPVVMTKAAALGAPPVRAQ